MTFALLSRLAHGTFLGVNLLLVLATSILIQKVAGGCSCANAFHEIVRAMSLRAGAMSAYLSEEG